MRPARADSALPSTQVLDCRDGIRAEFRVVGVRVQEFTAASVADLG